MLHRLLAIACVGSLASVAQADRVHLKGGTVIEGKVTAQGDRVLVELESGQIALPGSSVERIEESESAVERVDARLQKLKARDGKGLLALANECRDDDLPDSERKVLRKLLEAEPDHAEARARLGYVRSESGWITEDADHRARGMVKHDGVWLTPDQVLERERIKAATEAEKLARVKAELARKQADEAAAQRVTPVYSVVIVQPGGPATTPVMTYYPYPWWPRLAPAGPGFVQPMPIPGARDPRDMTFSIPGVQDPHRR